MSKYKIRSRVISRDRVHKEEKWHSKEHQLQATPPSAQPLEPWPGQNPGSTSTTERKRHAEGIVTRVCSLRLLAGGLGEMILTMKIQDV
ncbi:unnamed protein product [Gulo gulo]|uniref:Uncharacterized protein n=1 Tax=Gulo gulo TaxID=48420 RepID=A0A9X9LER3_GULGU|nr:unnamed protein product [Gulo gulo]